MKFVLDIKLGGVQSTCMCLSYNLEESTYSHLQETHKTPTGRTWHTKGVKSLDSGKLK